MLFLGRIVECKGIFDILKMAERLEGETPGGFQWRIFGAGEDFDRLQEEIGKRQLGHLVCMREECCPASRAQWRR